VGTIEDMKEQISLGRLLERGFKSFNQIMRKFSNETNRIGKKNLLMIGKR
jgi:hypothetical protein